MRAKTIIFEILSLTAIAIVPLFYKLGQYHIQPTADLWIHRSAHFAEHVIHGKFSEAVLQYHPGITVMGAAGAGITAFNNLADIILKTRPDIFSSQYFPLFFFATKFPVVLMNLGLLILSYLLLKKIFNRKIALIFFLLALLEPFMLANMRSLHLDAPLTLFAFNTFLLLYTGLRRKIKDSPLKRTILYFPIWIPVLSGIFLGLSVLTKTTNLFLLPVMGIILLIHYRAESNSVKNVFKQGGVIFGSSLATFWLLNPAMWVAPLQTLRLIFYEGIFKTGLGDVGTSLLYNVKPEGLIYHLASYPITILFRASPFLILGLLTYAAKRELRDSPRKRTIPYLPFFRYLAIFCGIYLLFMIIPSKKIYRYVLPLFPPLLLAAAVGLNRLVDIFNKKIATVVFFALLYGQALLFLPYLFAYFNPLLGGLWGASRAVNMKQDGTGYFEVAEYLNLKENADQLTVASYDWIPLGMIFKGETISVRRAEKPITADYILLPVQYREEYVDTNNYELEQTFEVYGFEYWRLYKKHTNGTNRNE